jgi:hypothetical protein
MRAPRDEAVTSDVQSDRDRLVLSMKKKGARIAPAEIHLSWKLGASL